MRETFVVNLYKEEFDVYIGRKGKGQDGYYGNPFARMPQTESIALFRKYFYERLKSDPVFNLRIRSLKGKILGCFCKPKACHGDVIAEYLNGLPEEVPIRLAVICSRIFHNYKFMAEILQWYDVKEIISEGTEFIARYAAEHVIPLREFKPEWNRHGSSAGYRCDEQIIDVCDEAVVFWNGKTKRTKHIISIAEEKNKPVSIYWPADESSIPHDEISML